MRVLFKDLPKEKQKEIRSIMNGNGLKVRDAIIHKEGDQMALEIKKLDIVVTVD